MNQTQQAAVVGVFADRQSAQSAVNELRRVGFREDQIGVLSRGEHDTVVQTDGSGSKWAEGAAAGAATGAGVGALWALGLAAGVLPAIGPVIAGGILASVLAGAAGGAAAGGLIGALIGLGVPEEEAHYYESEFRSGRTVVTVRADGRRDEARAILSRFGGYDRSSAPATAGVTARATESAHVSVGRTTPAAVPTAGTASGHQVQLHEEHLRAEKQPVQTGEVRVSKEVVTEHKNIQVPVTREEIVIERHPVHGQASSADIRPGEQVRIPVKEEKVHVTKEAVVTEEVTVGKRKVQETHEVSGEVRKEKLHVDKTGDVNVRGNPKK